MFSSKKNSSNVWQGIVENAKIVRQGTRFSVGNGRRTLFWDHCWATKTPLSSMAMSPIPIESQDRTIKEYWNLNGPEKGDWKWVELSTFLSGETLKMISSHSLDPSCEDEDSMYWGGSTTGKFSVKSAVNLIRNDGDEQHDKKWDLVWKAPVSERIRMFIWLAIQDRLLSNVQRVARKLSDDPRCTRCGAQEESLDHILRRCPFSVITWKKLSYHPPNSSFWTFPLCEWIMENSETTQPKNDYKRPMMFCITIWWLWKWRNNKVFGRDEEIPNNPINFLYTKLKEMHGAIEKDKLTKQIVKVKKEILIPWVAPPISWVLLNTDGASRGNPGEAGGGGILRDAQGYFIRAFAENYGICTVTRSEILALLRGILMARDAGIKKLIIKVDSQVVVQLMEEETLLYSPAFFIVNKCRDLLRRSDWEVKLEHCYREANRPADWLANYGCEQQERVCMFESPLPILGRSSLTMLKVLFGDVM